MERRGEQQQQQRRKRRKRGERGRVRERGRENVFFFPFPVIQNQTPPPLDPAEKEREREGKEAEERPVGRAAARCVGGKEDLRDSLRECFSMSLVPPPLHLASLFSLFRSPSLSSSAREPSKGKSIAFGGPRLISLSLSFT